jgi:hypothetical protein
LAIPAPLSLFHVIIFPCSIFLYCNTFIRHLGRSEYFEIQHTQVQSPLTPVPSIETWIYLLHRLSLRRSDHRRRVLFSRSQLTSGVIAVSPVHRLHSPCDYPVPCQLGRTLVSQHTIESALVPDGMLPCCPSAFPESALLTCSSMPHEFAGLRVRDAEGPLVTLHTLRARQLWRQAISSRLV